MDGILLPLTMTTHDEQEGRQSSRLSAILKHAGASDRRRQLCVVQLPTKWGSHPLHPLPEMLANFLQCVTACARIALSFVHVSRFKTFLFV